jgi:hypothetical protein
MREQHSILTVLHYHKINTPNLTTATYSNENRIRKYQMLIGMAQWACVIGRLDIGFAVSSLSRFLAAPRQGHLESSTTYLVT